jgi:hypothetical protein
VCYLVSLCQSLVFPHLFSSLPLHTCSIEHPVPSLTRLLSRRFLTVETEGVDGKSASSPLPDKCGVALICMLKGVSYSKRNANEVGRSDSSSLDAARSSSYSLVQKQPVVTNFPTACMHSNIWSRLLCSKLKRNAAYQLPNKTRAASGYLLWTVDELCRHLQS